MLNLIYLNIFEVTKLHDPQAMYIFMRSQQMNIRIPNVCKNNVVIGIYQERIHRQ